MRKTLSFSKDVNNHIAGLRARAGVGTVSTQQEQLDNSALIPSEEDRQEAKMLEVDGNRPITANNQEKPDRLRDYID